MLYVTRAPWLLTGLIALGACTSSRNLAASNVETRANPVTWHEKMQGLSQALSRLLPLVSSRAKFNNPQNAAAIEEDTVKIRSLAHGLKSTETPNADPSLKMMTNLFSEDLDRALEGLRGGNRDYARQILKDTTSYCIQCHTQTNNGPDFPRLALNINTNELTSLEQAEFFAATRQFTPSLEAYQRVLEDKTFAKTDPFAWEQAARSALAIVVRVKNDPKEASSLLGRIEMQTALPEAMKRSVRDWKKSVRAWAREPQKPLSNTEAILVKAEQLIQQARRGQEFPLDHSQDVAYFRAASLLHDLLGSPDRTKLVSAKALYLSGLASEATRDMNFWTLHETYYEQCVRTLPHSEIAEKCFAQLKESITVGYSGSSGTKVPPEIQKRLESLESLAGQTSGPSVKRREEPVNHALWFEF